MAPELMGVRQVHRLAHYETDVHPWVPVFLGSKFLKPRAKDQARFSYLIEVKSKMRYSRHILFQLPLVWWAGHHLILAKPVPVAKQPEVHLIFSRQRGQLKLLVAKAKRWFKAHLVFGQLSKHVMPGFPLWASLVLLLVALYKVWSLLDVRFSLVQSVKIRQKRDLEAKDKNGRWSTFFFLDHLFPDLFPVLS